jgi:two-component system, chemotaxis family, CheB/CheR fusion protein
VIVFHPLIDTFPGPVWIQDIAGRLIWRNDTWRRYAGSEDELIDEYYSDRFHPEDSDRLLMAIIECARVGGWGAVYARIKDSRGAYHLFFIQLGYYIDPDEGAARWVGIAMDAPGTGVFMDTASQWGKALGAMLEDVHVASWSWDLITDILEGSPYFFVLLGLDRTSPNFTRGDLLHFVQGDDRPLLLENMNKAVSDLGNFQQEFRINRADGEERWLCASGQMTAEIGPGGLHMVGILSDITARVVRERNKDRFIGIASHELRTPITSIKAYSQLLKRQMIAMPGFEDAPLLDRLAAQADRLAELARILLDSTSISERQLILDYRWFDLRELILQCVEAIRAADQSKPVLFDNGYTGMVYADEERIHQVCNNLLTNALKFSQEGSPVAVRTWRDGEWVGCAVQDNGTGIPEGMIDKIFDPFVQVQGEGRPHRSGLGLGLYISAGIIRKHGGRITVASEPRKGSLFKFMIPAGMTPGEGGKP